MTKLLKVVVVAGTCIGAAGFALSSADLGGETDSLAAPRGSAVTVSVAPPHHNPGATPAVDLAPSLPQTPPLPERAPRIPPIALASNTIDDAKPVSLGDAAAITVTARPSPVRAGPSSTASMLYGFPAGRQVRVIGDDGAFVQVTDVESGAQGWIEKDALASGLLTASIEPRPAPAARVRQARAEIDGPKPVTEIEAERHRPRLPDAGQPEDAADNGSKTNFAGLLRRGFGAN